MIYYWWNNSSRFLAIGNHEAMEQTCVRAHRFSVIRLLLLLSLGSAVIESSPANGQEKSPSSAGNPAPAVAAAGSGEVASAEQLEFFEKQVRPLLVTHCYECHSGESPKLQAGLRLDHRDGFLVGGDSGPSILPGDAQASLLVESIRYESYEMPPKGKLAEHEIEVLVQWINSGAPWPDEAPPALANSSSFDIHERGRLIGLGNRSGVSLHQQSTKRSGPRQRSTTSSCRL